MIRLQAALYCAVLSLMFCLLGGCVPAGDVQVDEQKDPHYQRGKTLVGSQDFKGAMLEFEKALEANPRSASAHFELGWLCEEKTKDYAEAIYHYRKHLALQPNSDSAERAQERAKFCMEELAKAEYSQPNTQNLQRDIDRLTGENAQLKSQLENMRTQLVASASALATAQHAAATAESQRAAVAEELAQTKAAAAAARNNTSSRTPTYVSSYQTPAPIYSVTTPRAHVHIVRSRETLASIAQQHGISISALRAANPRLDPRKLKVGQSLNLP